MVQTDEKVIYSFLKGSFTVKNPNGASENDKGSSHLKKNWYRVGFELLLMKRQDHHPIEAYFKCQMWILHWEIVFCDSREI